jgi:hypothetical protein
LSLQVLVLDYTIGSQTNVWLPIVATPSKRFRKRIDTTYTSPTTETSRERRYLSERNRESDPQNGGQSPIFYICFFLCPFLFFFAQKLDSFQPVNPLDASGEINCQRSRSPQSTGLFVDIVTRTRSGIRVTRELNDGTHSKCRRYKLQGPRGICLIWKEAKMATDVQAARIST